MLYVDNNYAKAYLAPYINRDLPYQFGGVASDYSVSYGGLNPNFISIETSLDIDENDLANWLAAYTFVQPTSPILIQTQLDNATRGLFIKRKFSTILDKVEIKTWQ